jgi:hypothetical protein
MGLGMKRRVDTIDGLGSTNDPWVKTLSANVACRSASHRTPMRRISLKWVTSPGLVMIVLTGHVVAVQLLQATSQLWLSTLPSKGASIQL